MISFAWNRAPLGVQRRFRMTANSAGSMPREAATRPFHRSGTPDFVDLVADDPHVSLERGAVLFAEGDPPSCMYIVKRGLLEIRSGNVIFEHVGPGAIVGEMGLVEERKPR